jgi:thiol-disulfide isomerase/thioredoxin
MKKLIPITILFILISNNVFSQDSNISPDSTSTNTGELINFSSLEDAGKNAESRTTVLFFFANWCPSCRSAHKNIKTNLNKLQDITIIIVKYDTSSELKRRYGVTYQHTFVQIDSQGNKISLWNGGDVYKIIENIEKMRMN